MTKQKKRPKKIDGLIEVAEQDGGVLLYKSEREEAHYLNRTAALVLELCTGENTTAGIARRLREAYGLAAAPQKDVEAIVRQMSRLGLVQFVP